MLVAIGEEAQGWEWGLPEGRTIQLGLPPSFLQSSGLTGFNSITTRVQSTGFSSLTRVGQEWVLSYCHQHGQHLALCRDSVMGTQGPTQASCLQVSGKEWVTIWLVALPGGAGAGAGPGRVPWAHHLCPPASLGPPERGTPVLLHQGGANQGGPAPPRPGESSGLQAGGEGQQLE